MFDFADIDQLRQLRLVHSLRFLTDSSKCFLGVFGLSDVRVIAVLGDEDSIGDLRRGCRPIKDLQAGGSGCLGRILLRPKLMESRNCSCPLDVIKISPNDIFLDLDLEALEGGEATHLDARDEASRERRLADAQFTAFAQQVFKNTEAPFSCPKNVLITGRFRLDDDRVEEADAPDAIGKFLGSFLGEGFSEAVLGDADVIKVDKYQAVGGHSEISKVTGSTYFIGSPRKRANLSSAAMPPLARQPCMVMIQSWSQRQRISQSSLDQKSQSATSSPQRWM